MSIDLGLGDVSALVAGGGRGVGAAVARLLARSGARVAVLSRSTDEVEQVAADIRSAGGVARAWSCDLTVPAQIDAALADITAAHGAPLVVVHTASAHFSPKKLHNLGDDEAARLMDADLQSAIRLCARVVPEMMAARFGRIVLCGSLAGQVGVAGGPLYASSKVALEGLARGLALDYGRYGVTANVARLGFVSSERLVARLKESGDDARLETLKNSTATKKIPSPDDVAPAIAFLCSRAAWPITGAAVEITAGSHLNSLW